MTKEIETNVMTFRGQRWEEMTQEERTESIEWAKSVCNKGVFEDPRISWRDFQFASEWLMHYQRRNDPVFKEITEKDVYGQERWSSITATSYTTMDGVSHTINWKCTPKEPCFKGGIYHTWFIDYFKHRGINISAIVFKQSNP